MPSQITSRIAAVFQKFTLVFLFFTSLLLHHSMDLRLAHARHFRHVGFQLVAITLLSRWRQHCHSNGRPGDSEYHSVAFSTSVTSLELGESYAGPEYAMPAAEELMPLRHLSRLTDNCCGTELISESELESESEMPFRFRRWRHSAFPFLRNSCKTGLYGIV